MVTAINGSKRIDAVSVSTWKDAGQMSPVSTFANPEELATDQVGQATTKSAYRQEADGAEIFPTPDSGDTGFITRQDAESRLSKLAREIGTQEGKNAGSENTSAASSLTAADANGSPDTGTDTFFNAKDANKDGVVSYEENLIYAMHHPSE